MAEDARDDAGTEDRAEAFVLTVGRVWREARVSCPHIDLLRAFRDGGLDTEQAEYIRFHVERADCPYCQARLEELDRKDSAASRADLEGIRDRLMNSTMTFLRESREEGGGERE